MGTGASRAGHPLLQVYGFGPESIVGTGKFAAVYRASLLQPGRLDFRGKPIPDTVAVKVVSKEGLSEEKIERLLTECRVLQSLDHENCVRYYEHFETRQVLYIVMEYVEGFHLFQTFKKLGEISERHVSTILYDLFKGLDYLASKKIVHNDLKPENIMCCADPQTGLLRAKIVDFGMAIVLPDNNNEKHPLVNLDLRGSLAYISPEKVDGHCGSQSDWWAAGVIIYVLLCGYPPFPMKNRTRSGTLMLIRRCSYGFREEDWDIISPDAINVIKKLLVLDVSVRASPSEILNMPWIHDHNEQSLINLSEVMNSWETKEKEFHNDDGDDDGNNNDYYFRGIKSFASKRRLVERQWSGKTLPCVKSPTSSYTTLAAVCC